MSAGYPAPLDPILPCRVAPLFGLAPGGVCLARPVTRPAGELLPHRFTLTSNRRESQRIRGGLFSVALSLSEPLTRALTVGVTHHRTLWSPDFPPRHVPGWPASPIDCSFDFTQPPRAPRRSSRPPRTHTPSYGASRRSTSDVVGPQGSSLIMERIRLDEVQKFRGADSLVGLAGRRLALRVGLIWDQRACVVLVGIFPGIGGPGRFLGGFLESLCAAWRNTPASF